MSSSDHAVESGQADQSREPNPSTAPSANARRRAVWILTIALLLSPAVFFAAVKALKSTSNDPRQWLPKSFAATDTYDWFGEQFGSDEIAVVSWPGCDLDDPRVPAVSDALVATPFFQSVRTGPNTLERLGGLPLNLARSAAIRRLKGSLIGADETSTCLVLTTSPAGQDDRTGAVAAIEQVANEVGGIAPSELKLAGPTVDAAMIDAESRKLLFGLAGLSAIVSFGVATFRLQSIRLAISVLLVAVYCTALGLAVLYLSGTRMNLLMTMLPPLIYVLTVSSAVHLANYYRDALQDCDADESPVRLAVSHGWVPCSLAALTTAIGLISLVFSKIEPIQEFGLFSSIGVVLSVIVLFVLLPSALIAFPPRLPTTTTSTKTAPIAGRFANFVIRRHAVLALACLVLMGFCGWRIPSIESTVRLQDRFLPESDVIDDYRWLEQKIGPMVPLEVVVHFDNQDPRDRVEQIKLVAKVQAKIAGIGDYVTTMSAFNFSPSLPRGHSVSDIVARKIINGKPIRDQLTETRFLRETDDEKLWRISVRANAIGSLDYGLLAERIQKTVEPILVEENIAGTFTGVIPLIYKAQRQLLMDLLRSFVVAFAIIAFVLVFVLRSVSATCLTMLPNIFPAVIVFGGVQWLGIPAQIGSVMTASAALGIAVDDTVHLLTWFRRGIQEGRSRHDAIRNAFARCAGAMVHTTLICSSGLIVFALSTFVPVLHFAYLMVVLLVSALIGDLILLPAILAGPLGKTFEKRSSANAE
ncbi:efflux RND transporter permease subunit [Roseiconus lacunae]|uniref:MMPL family transporter n=1 Tax=Roseiconus lacunae TaxID=2605694 RepID=A0ABT7PGT4_9BACT|nr:MMPL family transporter [Roseiconus lacunae]MCD0460454.1 MMPL family transporter [Roseiconus lacunae]MDM4015499.1 MMPL family transporter [Roseiconus lacunae]